MTDRHQAVDQFLVLRGPIVVQRAEVLLPLRQGLWSGNDAANGTIGQYPGDCKMDQLGALGLTMRLQFLRDL